MYIYTTTHTLNYSQQELSDRFTLQPGGTNIHALKLPSAVSSGIRLTTTALKHTHTHTNTHTHTHTHTLHYTPASHSSRTSHTSRSRPVGILQPGGVTEEVAHPVVKAGTGSSQLFLQIFSLPGPARAQTAKKDRNV